MGEEICDSYLDDLLWHPYGWPFETMEELEVYCTWWQAMAWVSFAVQLKPELVIPETSTQINNYFRRWMLVLG